MPSARAGQDVPLERSWLVSGDSRNLEARRWRRPAGLRRRGWGREQPGTAAAALELTRVLMRLRGPGTGTGTGTPGARRAPPQSTAHPTDSPKAGDGWAPVPNSLFKRRFERPTLLHLPGERALEVSSDPCPFCKGRVFCDGTAKLL